MGLPEPRKEHKSIKRILGNVWRKLTRAKCFEVWSCFVVFFMTSRCSMRKTKDEVILTNDFSFVLIFVFPSVDIFQLYFSG